MKQIFPERFADKVMIITGAAHGIGAATALRAAAEGAKLVLVDRLEKEGEKTESMLKRDATAEEQAASLLFPASDDAAHMTGSIIATDGGWMSF